ncbi:MAG: hypothetical protein ACRD37_14060, partial [Candidatus Acidiferrales bacterium]
VEDHIDSARFNHILWEGLMGAQTAYPKVRDGRDLRENRGTFLLNAGEQSPRQSKTDGRNDAGKGSQ